MAHVLYERAFHAFWYFSTFESIFQLFVCLSHLFFCISKWIADALRKQLGIFVCFLKAFARTTMYYCPCEQHTNDDYQQHYDYREPDGMVDSSFLASLHQLHVAIHLVHVVVNHVWIERVDQCKSLVLKLDDHVFIAFHLVYLQQKVIFRRRVVAFLYRFNECGCLVVFSIESSISHL